MERTLAVEPFLFPNCLTLVDGVTPENAPVVTEKLVLRRAIELPLAT
jgi:hypothetical protein